MEKQKLTKKELLEAIKKQLKPFSDELIEFDYRISFVTEAEKTGYTISAYKRADNTCESRGTLPC